MDERLISPKFPRSNAYNPRWIEASISGGAHSLWLTEWLTSSMELRPGMRVLDLGCGKAASSIFLHREFGLQVWATDLWFNAGENLRRIRDAGVEHAVFPVHVDARSLPFAAEFFDAVVSIDSFVYYGTDDLYLNYLTQFVKPNGLIGIAGAGLMREIEAIPDHLREWWEPGMRCLHSSKWWQSHWERSGIASVQLADDMDEWLVWLDWQEAVCPENSVEIAALKADRGRYLGYVRAIARRKSEAKVEAPIVSMPSEYRPAPLLRDESSP
jgi:cyclopropane fatty-acyl-phospholipid synthase-like methyltransferase